MNTETNIPDINTKAEGDCGYVAGYKGKKIGIYAGSLYAASELAKKHLKVTKKDQGLFWITLAEDKEGNVVSQSTMA
jgi:hypothetical protein